MASFPQMSARCAALVLVLGGCLSSGCVTTGGALLGDSKPREVPVQLGVMWNHEVAFAPDPVHNGTPTPGLVGRIYIFGQVIGTPLEGDGALHVELWEGGGSNRPTALEQWDIDPVTLRKFQRRDAVGPGYSVFLPWSTYRPDLTNVVMKVAYKPKTGAPLYASPSSLVLTTSMDPTPGQPVNLPQSLQPMSPMPPAPMNPAPQMLPMPALMR
jgi:hypothetical protein